MVIVVMVAVVVIMMMVMVTVLIAVFVRRIVVVVVMVFVTVLVRMAVVVFGMNVELGAFDLETFLALGVQVVAVQVQLLQFVLELVKINAEIEHRANKHIAADAAEDVEVESFHERYSSTLFEDMRHILCSWLRMLSSRNSIDALRQAQLQ